MNKKKILTLLVLSILLSACLPESETDSEPNLIAKRQTPDISPDYISPLLGRWVTESCEQASDDNDSLVNVWVKGLYEFMETGIIRLGYEVYLDSDCVIHVDTGLPREDPDTPVIYLDYGSQLLQEGIDGGGIYVKINSGGQYVSLNRFYTMDNNSLCFSDALRFKPFMITLYPQGPEAIDFTRCLNKSLATRLK